MATSPAPEEQGPIEAGRAWLTQWWGGKSKEQRVQTMWRLWLIGLAMIVIIGGFSMWKRQAAKQENTTGREWVENAAEGAATNDAGRAAIPGAGGMAQPGMQQPGAEQPGMGQPGMQQPGAAQPGGGQRSGEGGRGSIPPATR